jgi:predicted ATPase/DNA-binding CsgD family transcriptional regulator
VAYAGHCGTIAPVVEAHTGAGAGISPREAEVLRAVGEHLTNAEIAARLFISVRTVESHVSSLLRKLGLSDRRELAQLAARTGPDPAAPRPGSPAPRALTPSGPSDPSAPSALPVGARPEAAPGSRLPMPLTPFVGRVAERAALADALATDRLVTAVGPGGVGKTRLALAVAGDVADRFVDGVWYVDLVPVSDPAMVAPAVARAIGLGAPSARSAEDTVSAALTERSALLVLDNCEHLAAGVAVLVERLLVRCPHLAVLATSRARLLVPFERVFPVPGLSLVSADGATATAAADTAATTDAGGADVDLDGGPPGDAVALFLSRATAVGSPVTRPEDIRRVAEICRALDGVALAIELAAARLPALGLDGLASGLGDRLRLLAGGSRADERHSSLRAALDWSYELLEPVDQAVLRRLSTFASRFTVEDATAVAGFPPVPEGKETEAVVDAIGRLVEQSLMVVVPTRYGTRYRVLETIRQYGAGRLEETGEDGPARERHLHWCMDAAAELAAQGEPGRAADGEHGAHADDAGDADRGAWCWAFDAVADDLRTALGWVAARPDRRAEAHDLAWQLAGLAYRRGLPGEAQRRYEQAAELAEGVAVADALQRAGGAAASRQAGDAALRIYEAAARAALDAGDRLRAARALAWVGMLAKRAAGIMAHGPPPLDADAVVAEARELAGDDLPTRTAVAVAAAFDCEESDPAALALAREAGDLARQAGDVLMESAALDNMTVVLLAIGDSRGAADCTRRRIELLAGIPLDASTGFELGDAYHMAVDVHVGLGDVRTARRYAASLLRFPAYREGHLGACRLVVGDALAGEWDRVLPVAARFRANWEQLGRPIAHYLSLGAGAVTMVHGLRGDEAARDDWLAVTWQLRSAMEARTEEDRSRWEPTAAKPGINAWAPTFDALVLLHQGRPELAVAEMRHDPDDMREWYSGNWRHWYAAVWAEAAVLAGHPDAEVRLERAADLAVGNPIATAMVDRTIAWRRGDRDGLLAAAGALGDAACPYQQARTLLLTGPRDEAATLGAELMAAMGATPMAVPPPPG